MEQTPNQTPNEARSQALAEGTWPPKMRCPSCGQPGDEFLSIQSSPIRCAVCGYAITWDGACWDACVDKSFPRDFARQWVLWEAGKLGDPNLVYGNDPKHYFSTLLNYVSMTEEELAVKKILEIGYGHGRTLQEVQKRSRAAYGIDLARPPRSSRLREGSAIFGNLLNIPFVPGQFDLVICRGVLHHMPEPRKAFECIVDQVAKGGTLYLGGLYEQGKGSLMLRKILPGSWNYPEPLQLGFASIFGAARSVLEGVQTGAVRFADLKKFYKHYKLDAFDIMTPRWTNLVSQKEAEDWFASRGFTARKVGYGDYVAVKA